MALSASGTVAGKPGDRVLHIPGFDKKTRIYLRGEAITTTPPRVLVVGASGNRDAVTSAMSHWSIDPVCCSGVQAARGLLRDAKPFIIFCDETLSDGTYRDLLCELSKPAKIRFVVISFTPDLDDHYNEALALGAFDMIPSPCQRSDVQWIAIRAVQAVARHSGNKRRP